MKSDSDTEKKSGDGFDRADFLLRGLVGRQLVLIEKSEFQLRLIFGPGTEFITSSPWRLCQDSQPLIGSGDFRAAEATVPFADLVVGAKVVSTAVSRLWETKLFLERGYVLEVFPDSVRYEIWESHLEVGLVIFSGGNTTLFPPASPSSVMPSQVHADATPDER
jgi:hypothetical protein